MSLATYDVPVDIIELIIDQASLQDNQFSTLRACALVGRDFVRPSQRRIFRSIEFKGQHVYGHGDPLDKYLRMQDILISTPELALYVRKFVLKDKTMGLRLVTQPLFPILLGKLERLTTFVLEFQRYKSGTGDWDQFSPALKQTLIDTCQLSSIGQLTFKYIKNLPPHCVT
ncbi:hypothetical protein BDQ17DRAFT_1331391 [Cyathus striatus]|nr:hypothetical protein BDQ17DRAFT_1331391 [Cyathus striatus]